MLGANKNMDSGHLAECLPVVSWLSQLVMAMVISGNKLLFLLP